MFFLLEFGTALIRESLLLKAEIQEGLAWDVFLLSPPRSPLGFRLEIREKFLSLKERDARGVVESPSQEVSKTQVGVTLHATNSRRGLLKGWIW